MAAEYQNAAQKHQAQSLEYCTDLKKLTFTRKNLSYDK